MFDPNAAKKRSSTVLATLRLTLHSYPRPNPPLPPQPLPPRPHRRPTSKAENFPFTKTQRAPHVRPRDRANLFNTVRGWMAGCVNLPMSVDQPTDQLLYLPTGPTCHPRSLVASTRASLYKVNHQAWAEPQSQSSPHLPILCRHARWLTWTR